MLSEEKVINVFMRSKDADMQTVTGTNNATDCMGYLRNWKTLNKRPEEKVPSASEWENKVKSQRTKDI